MLLWKILPPGASQPSYLFGTIHVRDSRAFHLFEKAKLRLAECEIFATEFAFSEMEQSQVEQIFKLPDGQNLREQLPRGAWKNLEWIAQKILKTPIENFEKMHPMAVSTLISQVVLQEDMPFSLDETLSKAAAEMGKHLTGVETFADQLATMKRIAPESHLQGLTWVLKNYGRYRRRVLRMVELYEKSEVEKLYKLARKDSKGMRKILLNDRNWHMARRFLEISASGSLFCAVGAGHLAGASGMLRLLKKAGCQISPAG